MRLLSLAAAMASAGLLAACGGSSGGSAAPAPAPVVPTTPVAVTLSGVVAKGAALPGATVTAKCATGTGTATTTSTGAYTLTITDGALPCVLEATASDASLVLHSVATGSADSATANITTLTELLVAQLSGQNPADYMASLDTSALAAAVTTSAVTTAQTAVVSTLTAAGVDASSIGNLVTGTLAAGTGAGYDGVLDSLQAAITAAGTTLAELTTTVATTAAGSTPSTTPAATPDTNSLPADLLLRPQAGNCAAVRSTTYRALQFKPSDTTNANDPVTTTDTFSFDTTTLTASYSDGSSETWTAAGNCSYTLDGGQSTITVSPAGVMVARMWNASTSNYRMGMAFPVQAQTVSTLEGSWNMLGWENNNGVNWGVNAGTFAVDSAGALTSAKCFEEAIDTAESACTTATTLLPVFSVNATGGFDLTSTDSADVWKDRVFAYRPGNGDLMLVLLNAKGQVNLATKVRTLGVPTVGEVNTGWNIAVNAGLVASDALSANTNTILTSDAATGAFTRSNQNVGSTQTFTQSLVNNVARNGYTHRIGEAVVASDGATVNVREMYSLKLRGTGLTAYYLPNSSTGNTSNARIGLSIKQ